ncbi:hypothetical protein K7887_14315 [Sutcliffiella horikoshii]|uniref:hypothetical protein n=1 Tax=Sutcliffiella horikoshii TaxID=79883 RepID=UPI001CC011C2|nr:hypothetical protein [Sutcliffiella horikoshii]UAL46098.1 hypothetical protein K7887_14315 [Sutcliffiella horikoshii]
MKSKLIFCLIFTFLASNQVFALDWAYPFVVYKGGVYEVTDESLLQEDIGKEIGEVKRKADDYSGNYYGDASNHYERGTKYFEITSVDPISAIAVEDNNGWIKAVYLYKAPFHWMNMFPYYILGFIALVCFVVISLRYASKKEQNNKENRRGIIK